MAVGSVLGLSLGPLLALCGHFGGLLSLLEDLFGPSGRFWGRLGPLGAILESFGDFLWGFFGASWVAKPRASEVPQIAPLRPGKEIITAC